MMEQPHTWTRITWKNKQVGLLRNDNKVYQTIRTPAHIYKKHNSFGISKELLEYLEQKTKHQLRQIRIIYKDQTGITTYKIGLETLKKKAKLLEINKEKQYHIDIETLKKIQV